MTQEGEPHGRPADQPAGQPEDQLKEPAPERILLVEDDDSFRRALMEILDRKGYVVSGVPTALEALDRLQEETVDLMVTDLVMPGMKGGALIEEVRGTFPEIPLIAITAFGSVEDAMALTRAGAADYLTKPFRTAAFLASVERALEESRSRRAYSRSRRQAGEHLQGIMGQSEPMRRLFDRIGRVANSPAPVLISGETGSGKELVARAVHRASGKDPFLPVNCGALPEHLLESELFGHVRGAFTGADRDKAGLFEAAGGGTLFLDEVGELPLSLQPKLLRAVETGEIRRVGDVHTRKVEVRIVAATHRDLAAAVEAGEFREDLFWRLNVLRLSVPPLRERKDDLALLVEVFLERLRARPGGSEWRILPETLGVLGEYLWPGNVRQLFSVLERAAAFAEGHEIRPEHLPGDLLRVGRRAELTRTAVERELTLAEVEKEYILEVLGRSEGNKTRAAEWLGIPRRTLYRRLEEYGRDSGSVTE
ncbi:MAG: sigma-54-dependent Fis family transcriptional regulator [Gemmatimonadales bacterium]|nr:MAG: sigma-54-dependent Fis family transcriptional regulator [Gemmatimonadales bacterium]